MPETGMDGWVIVGAIAAALCAFFAWRQLSKRKPSVDQTMTNSQGSSQTARRSDVKQTMDNATDSDQDA